MEQNCGWTLKTTGVSCPIKSWKRVVMAFDFSQSYIGFNSENSSFNFLKFISMCEDHD